MKRILMSIAAAGGLFGLIVSASGAPFVLTGTITNSSVFVVTGDLNGDGKPDLMSVDGFSTFTVATNAGNGIFVSNRTYNVGNNSQPVTAAIADINGDSKPDIITANFNKNTVTIFTNAGGGIFASNASYAVGSGPDSIVAQDINGDGKPDVIAGSYYDQTLTTLTNAGSGFPVSHTIPAILVSYAQYSSQIFAVADINGDGKRDIIAPGTGGFGVSFEVLTNAGGANFAVNAIYSTLGNSIQALAVADFNKDGKTDVAALCGLAVIVFTNGVNGNLTLSQMIALPGLAGPAPDFPAFYPAGGNPYPQMAAADLDGDSYTDLVVVAGISAGSLSVNDAELLFNSGSGGTFSTNYLTAGAPGAAGIAFSTGMYISSDGGFFSFAAADLNGDGRSDFVSAQQNSMIRVMTNVVSNVIRLGVPTNIVVHIGPNGFAQVNFASTWTNWMGSLPTTNTPFPSDFPFSIPSTNIITASTSYHLTSVLSGSTNATITVIVVDVPTITLFGPNPLTNFVGGYVEPGATASDPFGYQNIYVSGNLNTNVPGTYTVTYTTTNFVGNSAATNRTVVMVPVPSLGIASTTSNQAALFWPASGATNYTIQMSTNLNAGNWVNVPAANLLMGVSVTVTNSIPSAFFRIKPQ